MLYTVAEVSKLTKLSKVSIYKKLRLKELEEHITKEAGITYVDEAGLKLIIDRMKESDKLKDNCDKGLSNKEIEYSSEGCIAADIKDLSVNSELVKVLIEQLKVKDTQIHVLSERLAKEQELHQNAQVLLKQEQEKPKPDPLQLEEHLKEFDNRLMNIREQLDNRKNETEKKGIFSFLKR